MISVLRTVYGLIKPYKALMVVFLVLLLIETAYSSLSPLSFKYLIDDAFIPKNFTMFLLILGLLVGGGVIAIAAGLGSEYALAKMGEKAVLKLRSRLFAHVLSQSPDFFSRFESGTLMTRFSSDVSAVDRLLSTTLPGVTRGLLSVSTGLFLLFRLEWKMTLLMIAGSAVLFYSPSLLRGRSTAASDSYRKANDGFISTIEESLRGQRIIKGFHAQDLFMSRAKNQLNRLFHAGLRVTFLFSMLERIPMMGLMILNAIIIGYGGYLIFQDDLSVGAFIAFYTIFMSVGHSVYSLSAYLPNVIQAEVSLNRIEELLAYQPSTAEAAEPVSLSSVKAPIRFQNVSFGYKEGHDVLKDVTFTVPEGGYTAFVGTSGSGKSTALQLLLRFYDPREGAVLLGGDDLRLVRESDYRAKSGVVFQDSFLFNMSIRDNITLAHPGAADDAIESAAKAANIHDMIMQLPEGYHTAIEQYGGNLSGGQRQRIAIARALVRNPQLLVLDEVTSALDPATEAEINETIESFRGSKTIVSVTHRLSSVVRADHIVVFQDGRAMEQGTHDELLQAGGLYRQMWDKQNGFLMAEDGSYARVDPARLELFPFFAGLGQDELAHIAGLFRTETYEPDRTIVREGDEGDKFYMIARGSVAVLKADSSGTPVRVAVLQDGDHFGEIALLRNVPRTASIVALTPVILLTLRRKQLLELTSRYPRMMAVLEQSLAARLR